MNYTFQEPERRELCHQRDSNSSSIFFKHSNPINA